MICQYSKESFTALSCCDSTGCLSVPGIFAACQDIATEHAEIIGVGGQAMAEKGLFWMTARTRIHFMKRPAMLTAYHMETWPAAPGATRCDRFYRGSDENGTLFEGRTEWCVWDLRANRPSSPQQLFAQDMNFSDEIVLPGPYSRFRHDFTDQDRVMTYTVLPSDIDIGRHMNNVAYLRLLTNTFPAKVMASMPVAEMEIVFMMPCMEGEQLSVFRRPTPTGFEFGIQQSNGRYAALASITVSTISE